MDVKHGPWLKKMKFKYTGEERSEKDELATEQGI
jgi:hypothetical protein